MGKRFDFGTARKLCETLVKTASVLESETNKVQDSFTALGETFKDKGYTEFRIELNEADRTIASIVADIIELQKSIAEYAGRLSEI